MQVAIVLFTRDLRVHDNPALAAAVEAAERVLPLFVLDDGIGGTRFGAAAGRRAFLRESLADLDASLRRLGGALDVRRGEVVAETVRAARAVGATTVFASADVSPYAVARQRRLAAELDLRLVDGNYVVPAERSRRRATTTTRCSRPTTAPGRRCRGGRPSRLRGRSGCPTASSRPAPSSLVLNQHKRRMRGGETAGVERAAAWLREHLDGYGSGGHDAIAADATSRLSPYLHFGCVSPRALAVRARELGGDAFVRQLCWRDFYAQILFARPETQVEDMRGRGDRWLDDPEGSRRLERRDDRLPARRRGHAPAAGRGLDAQPGAHGHRLVPRQGSRDRLARGCRHFFDLLLDGDVAQNVGNWQWVAGTGVDTRPNRIYNPTAQLKKLDPDGDYVRRYVPELADVPAGTSPSLACWRRRTRGRSSITRRRWRRSGRGVASGRMS